MKLERIEAAKPIARYRVRLRFADGAEGVADLSPLVAQGGVLGVLAADFDSMRVIEHGRALAWLDAAGENVDLCADALLKTIHEGRVAAE